MEALERAAKVVGTQAKLAEVLGFKTRQGVSPWFMGVRKVPAEYCIAIERETRALGEPVTCEELRPDIAWAVLRSDDQQAA